MKQPTFVDNNQSEVDIPGKIQDINTETNWNKILREHDTEIASTTRKNTREKAQFQTIPRC